MSDPSLIAELTASFHAALRGPSSVESALQRLLELTRGNAVGLWKRNGDQLDVLGFTCDEQFPPEVAREFVAATRQVSLSQSGLGIVHATTTRAPAVALRVSDGGQLPGSGGWLERFGSVQSLSLPLLDDTEVIGVLALSTRFRFGESDPAWTIPSALAPDLATILAGEHTPPATERPLAFPYGT